MMVGNMGQYDVQRNLNSDVDIDSYYHHKFVAGKWGNIEKYYKISFLSQIIVIFHN